MLVWSRYSFVKEVGVVLQCRVTDLGIKLD